MRTSYLFDQLPTYSHVNAYGNALPLFKDTPRPSLVKHRQRAPVIAGAVVEPAGGRHLPHRPHGTAGIRDGGVAFERLARRIDPARLDLDVVVREDDDVCAGVAQTEIERVGFPLSRFEQIA